MYLEREEIFLLTSFRGLLGGFKNANFFLSFQESQFIAYLGTKQPVPRELAVICVHDTFDFVEDNFHYHSNGATPGYVF